MSGITSNPNIDYDVTLLHCDWCGKLMSYREMTDCEYTYTGTGGATVHLCFIDRQFVTKENLAVNGQLATDKTARDEAFTAYIAMALNPETSDELDYPWY